MSVDPSGSGGPGVLDTSTLALLGVEWPTVRVGVTDLTAALGVQRPAVTDPPALHSRPGADELLGVDRGRLEEVDDGSAFPSLVVDVGLKADQAHRGHAPQALADDALVPIALFKAIATQVPAMGVQGREHITGVGEHWNEKSR